MSIKQLTIEEVYEKIFVNSKLKASKGLVYTPFNLAKEMIDKSYVNKYNRILVVNALNGTLPIILRNKYPKSQIICAETFDYFIPHLTRLGFTAIKWDSDKFNKESKMKFDNVVGNPPYLKGVWRKFLKLSISLSKSHIAIISPDGTRQNSPNADKLIKILQDNGVQEITNCTKHFPAIESGDIVYYLLNKNKNSRPEVFIDTSKSGIIVDKILKQSNHKLSAILSKHRNKQATAAIRYDTVMPGTTKTLISVTKKGPIIKYVDKLYITEINADDYWFANRHFGTSANSPIFELTGLIGISTNILAIKKINGMTLEQFKKVYLSNEIRFVLNYLRTQMDTSPRHLKLLPQIKTLDVLNLSQKEKDYINTHVK